MLHRLRARLLLAALFGVVVPTGVAVGVSATSAAAGTLPGTCGGTVATPGVLSGSYSQVVVTGVCLVNAGPAHVAGNVVVAPGAALIAGYGAGGSRLWVGGSVAVGSGATFVLGCDPVSFACLDDPSQTSNGTVEGNVVGNDALGIIVHDSYVGGSILQRAGGGGYGCVPAGVYAPILHAPVYSDYENNTIDGSVVVTGMQSCWFGMYRNQIAGTVVLNGNTMADPDGNEVATNSIGGNFLCFGNDPAIQFGDAGGSTNQVGGIALGQCGFDVLLPDPAPDGPLTPISAHAG